MNIVTQTTGKRTYSWFHIEAEAPNEDVSIRRDDRDVLKLDLVRLVHDATTLED